MYHFDLEPSGILVASASGFWTNGEAVTYLAELASHLDKQRATYGRSLVLVQRTDAIVQPPDVMEAFKDLDSVLLVTDRDRAAYIVQSTLTKVQGQRLTRSERLKVFLSCSEARRWLLAS